MFLQPVRDGKQEQDNLIDQTEPYTRDGVTTIKRPADTDANWTPGHFDFDFVPFVPASILCAQKFLNLPPPNKFTPR